LDYRKHIGPHPVIDMIKGWVKLLIISSVLGGAIYLINEGAGAIYLVIWSIFWFFGIGTIIVSILFSIAGLSNYNSAKKAIISGFVPSYVGKNSLNQGIVMVDESRKRIYVNKVVYDFSDIKTIHNEAMDNGRAWRYYLEIRMKSGANPVQRVFFDTEAEASQFFVRLGNSLGFG